MSIHKVMVLGSGRMGCQIAMQTAMSGYAVMCYSNDAHSLRQAEDYAKGWFSQKVEKKRMTAEQAEAAPRNIGFSGDLKSCCDNADLVIEAVPDVLEIKMAALSQADHYTPDHAIYASNSSYLVSSLFCDAVKHSENVINLHFFNPALVMKLVEVVESPHCSRQTIETVREFALSIGKTPVTVKREIYGFIVNRIFSAITREACYLLDQDIASVEDIDTAVKLGLSHPMGPFELLDMTGIELEYAILMQKFRLSGDPADRPGPSLVEHYAKGEHGRGTGKGFYQYE